jgi:hypothetical protein
LLLAAAVAVAVQAAAEARGDFFILLQRQLQLEVIPAQLALAEQFQDLVKEAILAQTHHLVR